MERWKMALSVGVFLLGSSLSSAQEPGWKTMHSPDTNPLWGRNPPDINAVHGIINEHGQVEAWAVGDRGALVYYDGTKWQVDKTFENRTDAKLIEMNDIFMIDSTNMWAVGSRIKPNGEGEGALAMCCREGHWILIPKEGIKLNRLSTLNALSLVNENGRIAGWAVGDADSVRNNATILRFDTGSWTKFIGTNNNPGLLDVHTLSANDAWAVGRAGRETRYKNGDWMTIHDAPPPDRNTLDMTNPSYGWSAGAEGRMYEYLGFCDNGQGPCWWVNRGRPAINFDGNIINSSINGIDLLSETAGFIVGDEGIVASYDGNRNWNRTGVENDPKENLNDINCPRTNHCFAVGDKGTILELKKETLATETFTPTPNTPSPTDRPSSTVEIISTMTATQTFTPTPTKTSRSDIFLPAGINRFLR